MRFLEWFGSADPITQLYVLVVVLALCGAPVLIVGLLVGAIHG